MPKALIILALVLTACAAHAPVAPPVVASAAVFHEFCGHLKGVVVLMSDGTI